MILETEGIVLKSVKAAGGRRLLVIFTEKYGKLTVGAGVQKRTRKKSNLAQRPFTYGRYEIFENRGYYNYNSGDVIRSHYRVGEDIDRFAAASYVMELTEKVLADGVREPGIFAALKDFLDLMTERTRGFMTPVIAYELKLLSFLGLAPRTGGCALCGKETGKDAVLFSIEDGGVLCRECGGTGRTGPLIYKADFDIVNTIEFFLKTPIDAFRRVELKSKEAEQLQRILRDYIRYYLDIKEMRSESMFRI